MLKSWSCKISHGQSQHLLAARLPGIPPGATDRGTIATVANRGLSRTTLSDVAKAAGVSHGLVNFHFQTKESLLAETLSFMSEQHRAIWAAALERGAGLSPPTG